MSGVLPKVTAYAFLSVICLLINVALFMTALINVDTVDINSFVGSDTYSIGEDTAPSNYSNISASSFALTTGGSFIPFFSLLTFTTYLGSLPLAVTVVTTIIIGIIGAFQVFLLAIIILNMIPKVLGSGFDV